MKHFLLIPLLLCHINGSPKWLHNIDEAKAVAKSNHRPILLNFSGSDWCGPCIRMHKEIFGSEAFQRFADTALILVNADFPRLKKNQLSKEQQKTNDDIADKYNSKGAFPLTLLLDENGKILTQWDGMPNETPDEFIEEVNSAISHNKGK